MTAQAALCSGCSVVGNHLQDKPVVRIIIHVCIYSTPYFLSKLTIQYQNVLLVLSKCSTILKK